MRLPSYPCPTSPFGLLSKPQSLQPELDGFCNFMLRHLFLSPSRCWVEHTTISWLTELFSNRARLTVLLNIGLTSGIIFIFYMMISKNILQWDTSQTNWQQAESEHEIVFIHCISRFSMNHKSSI